MLHLCYGREDRDAYGFFFDRFGEGRHTVIVPEQFTHQAEARAIAAFGNTGLMDTEVVSFKRLGYKILEETGGGIRVPLNEDGRRMLLTRILREKETELTAFHRMTRFPGFAEKLDAGIAEFKQYDTPPEALRKAAEDETNTVSLRRKLADIATVYEAYEEAIRGRYLDTEDAARFIASKAKDASVITDRTFWILGFDPFSPTVEELFGMLLLYGKDVWLALTLDPEAGGDGDLFRLSGYFAEKVKALAETLGVRWDEQVIPDAYRTERTEPLRHLERQLFARKPKPYPEAVKEITFVRAAGPYAEIEAAASAICDLVRDGGYRYNEIAVLSNDMETRGPLAKRVFREYGIPVFLDEKKKIFSDPAVAYVLGLLDAANGGKQEDVFRVLKTGFTDIGIGDREYLENYAAKYRIRGSAWKKPFRYGAKEYANGAFVYGETGLARLNAIRSRVAELLDAFEKPFSAAKTAAEKTRALYAFLTDTARLPDRIDALRDRLMEQGSLDEAEELRQVWDALTDVLEQLVGLAGEEPLDADEYRALLEAGLASKEIGLIPPAVDRVVIGPARRLATGRIRALFVIGANEGILPAEGNETDLLSPEERAYLLAKDGTFCRDGGWISEEENLAIYRVMAKPAERLWISTALSDGSSDGTRESDVFTRLRAIFPKNIAGTGELSVLGALETRRAALPHLAKAFASGEPDSAADEWKTAYNWFLANDAETVAPVRAGLLYEPEKSGLRRDTAPALYRKELSPSRLERFSRCPFAHFVSYGLRPREERAFQTDPRSAGEVYHEALMELSKRLSQETVRVTDPASRWMTVADEELRELCETILTEVADGYREGLLGSGEEERYRRSRIGEVFFETAKALVRQVRTGTIDEMYLEEPFSRTSARLPAVPVETADGTYWLEGRIDRVDVLPGNFIKIIDYKSGGDTFKPKDASSGWRLQLMLYLTAALGPSAGNAKDSRAAGTAENGGSTETAESVPSDETPENTAAEKTPAGVLYFHISDRDVDLAEEPGSLDELLEKTVEASVRKTFAMNGIVLDHEDVLAGIVGEAEPGEIVSSLRRKKDGSFTGSVIDETAFRALLTEVGDNVKSLCTRMFAGETAAEPMRVGTAEDACKYCTYKPICMIELAGRRK